MLCLRNSNLKKIYIKLYVNNRKLQTITDRHAQVSVSCMLVLILMTIRVSCCTNVLIFILYTNISLAYICI